MIGSMIVRVDEEGIIIEEVQSHDANTFEIDKDNISKENYLQDYRIRKNNDGNIQIGLRPDYEKIKKRERDKSLKDLGTEQTEKELEEIDQGRKVTELEIRINELEEAIKNV